MSTIPGFDSGKHVSPVSGDFPGFLDRELVSYDDPTIYIRVARVGDELVSYHASWGQDTGWGELDGLLDEMPGEYEMEVRIPDGLPASLEARNFDPDGDYLTEVEWYEDGYVQLTSETTVALSHFFRATVASDDRDQVERWQRQLLDRI
ncbi:MAG: hypothetical protein ABEJ91_03935 [Candidatus Nanohaloarchaea archaeon]